MLPFGYNPANYEGIIWWNENDPGMREIWGTQEEYDKHIQEGGTWGEYMEKVQKRRANYIKKENMKQENVYILDQNLCFENKTEGNVFKISTNKINELALLAIELKPEIKTCKNSNYITALEEYFKDDDLNSEIIKRISSNTFSKELLYLTIALYSTEQEIMRNGFNNELTKRYDKQNRNYHSLVRNLIMNGLENMNNERKKVISIHKPTDKIKNKFSKIQITTLTISIMSLVMSSVVAGKTLPKFFEMKQSLNSDYNVSKQVEEVLENNNEVNLYSLNQKISGYNNNLTEKGLNPVSTKFDDEVYDFCYGTPCITPKIVPIYKYREDGTFIGISYVPIKEENDIDYIYHIYDEEGNYLKSDYYTDSKPVTRKK